MWETGVKNKIFEKKIEDAALKSPSLVPKEWINDSKRGGCKKKEHTSE